MTPSEESPVDGGEGAISCVLRVGVTVSLVVVSVGTILSFLERRGYGSGAGEVARLTGQGGAFPRTASWFLGGLAHLDGQAVIVAGLLLLIATPVLRVGVSLVFFARARERSYVAITAVVLALLIVSFILGKAG